MRKRSLMQKSDICCAGDCLLLHILVGDHYIYSGKETTPGPIEVIKLLFESFVNPIGNYVITGHLLVSLRRVLVGFSWQRFLVLSLVLPWELPAGRKRYLNRFSNFSVRSRRSPGFLWLSCSSASGRVQNIFSVESVHLRTLL